MEKIGLSRKEARLLLLHEFRLGHTATEATRNICATMGKGLLSYDTAKHWFQIFKEGKFGIEDKPHPGKESQVDVELLKQLIEDEPQSTSRDLAEKLECSHTTVEKHLHELGKKWKYGIWIPTVLTPYQLHVRINTCMELMSSHRNYQWLRNLITGDEKWVHYTTIRRKRR